MMSQRTGFKVINHPFIIHTSSKHKETDTHDTYDANIRSPPHDTITHTDIRKVEADGHIYRGALVPNPNRLERVRGEASHPLEIGVPSCTHGRLGQPPTEGERVAVDALLK